MPCPGEKYSLRANSPASLLASAPLPSRSSTWPPTTIPHGRVHPQSDPPPEQRVRGRARRCPIEEAQILSYLKGSFAALHKAMAAINEENMLKPVAASHSSQQKARRLQFAIDAVAHS